MDPDVTPKPKQDIVDVSVSAKTKMTNNLILIRLAADWLTIKLLINIVLQKYLHGVE